MSAFLLALQFLTILPVKVSRVTSGKIAFSSAWFPLVGLLLGWLLVISLRVMALWFFPEISAVTIIVVLLVIITGGLHLDGLSDTSDAVFSGRGKDEMLAIMRDSHVGVMGVLSIAVVLLLKSALLLAIGPGTREIAVLLMCVFSRWAMVFIIFIFRYARKEGKAAAYFSGMNLRIFGLAGLIALCAAVFIWQGRGVVVLFAVSAAAYLAARYINSKIRGITGDNLGAINEISEIAVLLTIITLKGGGG